MAEYPTVLIALRGEPRLGPDDGLVREVLVKYGCPRDIAYRVVRTLHAFNYKTTRVQPTVDLDKLRADLEFLGISVEKLEG